jgi:PhnB protein
VLPGDRHAIEVIMASPTGAGITYGRITTYLCAKPASDAIDFYKRAFDAEELSRMQNDDGTIGHAEIRIGATVLFVSDEYPPAKVFAPTTLNGSPASLVLDVDDADAALERALAAGATVERDLADEPYGRRAWIFDPFGHHWCLIAPSGS